MSDNNLKIQIVASLNTGLSIGEINSSIKDIEKKINKLNLKVNIDTGQIGNISKLIDNVQQKVNSSKLNVNVGSSNSLKDLSNATEKQLIETLKLNNAIRNQEVIASNVDRVSGKWTATIKESATQQRTLAGVIDKTTGTIYKQKDALSDVASRSLSVGEQIKTAISRTATWTIATSAIFGTINALKDMSSRLVEIDSLMVDLKRVMDAPDYKFNDMLNEAVVSSDNLSTKVTDMLSKMGQFAAMGFENKSLIDMSKTATVLQNISDLNSTEAVDTLTSAMINFNVSAKDSITIADKLNEVDNNFAVTTKDLSDGIRKSASTAKTFGVDLNTLVGYIAAIGNCIAA